MSDAADREHWALDPPSGGWHTPWPIAFEVLDVLPHTTWTLVGGLMVQAHAMHAGIPVVRPTVDLDIVLHIETGATTFSRAREAVEQLGFTLAFPVGGSVVHRFERDDEQIDIMVADHVAPRVRPKPIHGRPVFAVPGATAALKRTVNCELRVDAAETRVLSVPNALGALVLKGAAYRSDGRAVSRHLEDAALLAATMADVHRTRRAIRGSDRGRIQLLHRALSTANHPAWLALPEAHRRHGQDVLAALAADPDSTEPSALGW